MSEPVVMSALMPQVGSKEVAIRRAEGEQCQSLTDRLAIDEPLEIRLTYGPMGARQSKAISITMRTPGNDDELAAGFLLAEGVVRVRASIRGIRSSGPPE